jgi:hypothetical protein
MVYKKVINVYYMDLFINLNNIQNNQRKDNLKNYYKIVIVGGLNNLNQIYKRSMFTKVGNVRNLKKSGDLISTTDNNIIIKTAVNNPSELNSRSLDLANNIAKSQEQYIIEQTSISTTTVAIKNINSGMISPMKVNRYLATYGKINKNYTMELTESNSRVTTFSFIKYKTKFIREAEEAFNQKKISKDQFLVCVKRMNALDLSYVHATISDITQYNIVQENEEYVTINYHVITTKPTLVDYGGPNTFKPIFLYYDEKTNITYYTIPLTYILTLKKKEYVSYYIGKNKEAFENDTIDVQNYLAFNIKKISEITNFKMLNINEKCLKTNFSDIIPDEEFPNSIYSRDITCFVPTIPFLID